MTTSARNSDSPLGAAPAADSKARFSTRVDDYVRYRPRYPQALYDFLQAEAAIRPGGVVADVGSGTGIFAEPLLAAGSVVFAVEPNPDMRAAAERLLGGHPGFHSTNGSAEATTLPDHVADLVTCAQAFHWVDGPRAATEFARVLKPGGHVAVVWNQRDTAGSPFLTDYEKLLVTFGTDYRQVAREHRPMSEGHFSTLFGVPFRRVVFPNAQTLDFPALRGRVFSSSYTPLPGEPGHDELAAGLKQVFDRHESAGHVTLRYETELFFACLG